MSIYLSIPGRPERYPVETGSFLRSVLDFHSQSKLLVFCYSPEMYNLPYAIMNSTRYFKIHIKKHLLLKSIN